MTNYENAKIYKLVCDDKELIYYGSTARKNLNRRFSTHVHSPPLCCKQMFDVGNVKIVLVEECPCSSRAEMLIRERYYIDNNVCLNIRTPIITKEEYQQRHDSRKRSNVKPLTDKQIAKKESDRLRYQANKEKIKERVADNYELNRLKKLEYRRNYWRKYSK